MKMLTPNVAVILSFLSSSVLAQEESPAESGETGAPTSSEKTTGDAAHSETEVEETGGADPEGEQAASEGVIDPDGESSPEPSSEGAADPDFENDLARLEKKKEGTRPSVAKKKAKPKAKPKLEVEPAPEPEVDFNTLPLAHHQWNLGVFVGPNFTRATSDGLQPFAEETSLAEANVRAGGALFADGAFSLAALGGISAGGSEATVREQSSSLGLLHLNLGAEGRYHLNHRIYGYGRLSAGPEWSSMLIGEEDDRQSLTADALAFRGDANLGMAFRFAGSSDGRKRKVRALAFLEGGYRLSTQHAVELEVDEGSGPLRAESVELDSFSTSGLSLSLGIGLNY